jgi:hypothetical protein
MSVTLYREQETNPDHPTAAIVRKRNRDVNHFGMNAVYQGHDRRHYRVLWWTSAIECPDEVLVILRCREDCRPYHVAIDEFFGEVAPGVRRFSPCHHVEGV